MTRVFHTKQIDEKSNEPKTSWTSIYMCTGFIFLDGIQLSMFFVSMWPYLNKVDPSATATFFGFITASFSLGQTITSPIFGFWMNKVKSIKPPLTLCLLLMMAANLAYVCVELFPQDNRRYVMLAARLIVGFGAGNNAVCRAYLASAPAPKDRPRSVLLCGVAQTFGLTIGPAIPVIFTPIGYPGFRLIGGLHLDMYNIPAWISFIINIVSLILLYTTFQEVYSGVASEEAKPADSSSKLPEPGFNKFAAFVCIFSRFAILLVLTNNETVGAILSMVMYNWTDAQAIKNFGLISLGSSANDFVTNLFFIIWFGQFMTNRNLERLCTIFGLFLMLSFHVITFPWPFWPNKLTYSINYVNGNETEISGCYPEMYSWCSYTNQVPLALYVFAMVVLFEMSLSTTLMPINMFYSRILGNTRQGTMSGILIAAGSLARTIGPIIVSYLFEHYGPKFTWGMEIIVVSFTVSIWIIFYKKIVPDAKTMTSKLDRHRFYSNGSIKSANSMVERL